MKLAKILSLVALIASPMPALALSASSIPTKIPTYWATSAPPGNVTCPMPIPSQETITGGKASWTDGFPPLTFLSSTAGGVPPFGADFNGVLCQMSQWTRWYNAGAPVPYDSTFQTAIGGYPQGSIIASIATPGLFWYSTVDNNTTNPDTGGANWAPIDPIGAGSSVVTSSGSFPIPVTATTIGIQRTSSPAPSLSTLPSGIGNGRTIEIDDLASNFDDYPVTINAPAGTTIAGLPSVILNVNGQQAKFRYFASTSTWSCNCINASPAVGSVQIASGTTADTGYLLADGACVLQTSYPTLYAKIGNIYSSQDSCSTGQFGLPDLRGRVPAGADNMGGVAAGRLTIFAATSIGAFGGAQHNVVTQSYLASFTLPSSATMTSWSGYLPQTPIYSTVYSAQIGYTPIQGTSGAALNPGGSSVGSVVVPQTSINWTGGSISTNVVSGGGGQAFPTVQPTQIFYWEIKY